LYIDRTSRTLDTPMKSGKNIQHCISARNFLRGDLFDLDRPSGRDSHEIARRHASRDRRRATETPTPTDNCQLTPVA